ncbi:hypothetical protein ACFWFQ_16200 [Nocardia salmonicida]|uniref:hypothetical protein n=1 Tax=Nocardia salmonicida TaxID=53431 RepID=UPI003648EE55
MSNPGVFFFGLYGETASYYKHNVNGRHDLDHLAEFAVHTVTSGARLTVDAWEAYREVAYADLETRRLGGRMLLERNDELSRNRRDHGADWRYTVTASSHDLLVSIEQSGPGRDDYLPLMTAANTTELVDLALLEARGYRKRVRRERKGRGARPDSYHVLFPSVSKCTDMIRELEVLKQRWQRWLVDNSTTEIQLSFDGARFSRDGGTRADVEKIAADFDIRLTTSSTDRWGREIHRGLFESGTRATFTIAHTVAGTAVPRVTLGQE